MKRFVWAALLALAIASPAFAQSPSEDLSAARAKYGPLASRAQVAAILNEVAWKHRDEGFGLLGKANGNNCPQPKTRTAVSCDWLVNIKTRRGGDVLGSATNDDGSPAPATPQFNQGDTYDGANFVAPIEPDGPIDPPPPPPPPPPPAGDVATAELQRQQLALLLQIAQGQQQQLEAMRIQAEQLAAAIRDLKAEIAKGVRVRF